LEKSSRPFAKFRRESYLCNPFEKGEESSPKAAAILQDITNSLARPDGAGFKFRKAFFSRKETTFFDNLAERYISQHTIRLAQKTRFCGLYSIESQEQ
jgi:hypothetical protein